MTPKHECLEFLEHKGGHFGKAVGEIFFAEDGKWMAMSGINEYFSEIIYCPFCGVKL